jgi:hypothetical protein
MTLLLLFTLKGMNTSPLWVYGTLMYEGAEVLVMISAPLGCT